MLHKAWACLKLTTGKFLYVFLHMHLFLKWTLKGERVNSLIIWRRKTQWLFKWIAYHWVSRQRQDRPWLALTNAWNVTEALIWRMKIENIRTPPLNYHLQMTGQSQCKVGMLVRVSAWKVTKTWQHSDIRKMWARGLQIWQALHWSILTPSGFLCKAAQRCQKMTKQCGSFSQMQKKTGALIELQNSFFILCSPHSLCLDKRGEVQRRRSE